MTSKSREYSHKRTHLERQKLRQGRSGAARGRRESPLVKYAPRPICLTPRMALYRQSVGLRVRGQTTTSCEVGYIQV